MTIFVLLITFYLEQKKFLVKFKLKFEQYIKNYVELFSNRTFKNQREIRYVYLIASIPVILLLLIIKLIFSHYFILDFIFNLIIFSLSIHILSWREKSKNINVLNSSPLFIQNYAIRFFSTLFWFFCIPSSIGLICYLIIIAISSELKNKGIELLVYNEVVDKMLFYANIIPYLLLYLFIAIAGNFENVFHHLLSQRKKFIKSYYYLDSLLYEIILLAVDKNKFQITNFDNYLDYTESSNIYLERFKPQIVSHINAILYRAGIFFIITIAIINIVRILSFAN